MKALAIEIGKYFLLALAAYAGYYVVDTLRTQNAQLKDSLEMATGIIKDRNWTIAEMKAEEHVLEMQRIELDGKREGIELALKQSEKTFRRLLNEDKELRAWADTAVPAVVGRLRDRPAITGADRYLEDVSRRNALHAVGSGDSEELGP